ncbi:MAG: glycosyltransferase [Rhodopseudomonas sp.]|nr:glycosyltransferase [Rhodopseudomonas sp.]
MTPVVSVIIPTYNRAGTLARAIDSVLAQTWRDLELIVVDDASSDGSRDVIAGYADNRLRYLRHDARKGGAAARNTGIVAARADLVAFQDSDDAWLPEKLQAQIEYMNLHAADAVVYTGMKRFNRNGSAEYIPPESIALRQGDILPSLLRENFVSTQTILVRKALLEEIGMFDPDLPRFQDWDLVLRLAARTSFGLIDRPLVDVYETAGNISSIVANDLPARLCIIKKQKSLFERRPSLLLWQYYSMAKRALRRGEFKSLAVCVVSALKCLPLFIRSSVVKADSP